SWTGSRPAGATPPGSTPTTTRTSTRRTSTWCRPSTTRTAPCSSEPLRAGRRGPPSVDREAAVERHDPAVGLVRDARHDVEAQRPRPPVVAVGHRVVRALDGDVVVAEQQEQPGDVQVDGALALDLVDEDLGLLGV